MSVCSSGSPPLAFIWFSLHVIHLANKSSSSSSSPLSFRTENWHIGYTENVYINVCFSTLFCFRVRSPCGADRQTDGQDM